jgi:hypothetical protein
LNNPTFFPEHTIPSGFIARASYLSIHVDGKHGNDEVKEGA